VVEINTPQPMDVAGECFVYDEVVDHVSWLRIPLRHLEGNFHAYKPLNPPVKGYERNGDRL